MDSKRIGWVDIARGIGIFLVVIGHVSQNPYLGKVIYSFHMPLFFILSGYLYKNIKNLSLKEFVRKKAKSILVPYFIFGIFTLLYWIIIERKIRNQTESPIWQFANIFLCFGGDKNYIYNIPLWFLPALLNTEIIFNFFMQKREKYVKILILIISIIGVVYSKYINIRLPFCLDTLMVTLPFYALGYYLKEKYNEKINEISDNKIKSIKIYILIPLLLIVTIVLSLLVNKRLDINNLQLPNYIVLYLCAISGSIAIILMSMKIKSRIFKYLGINSLVIMSLHEPIKRIVIILFSKITTFYVEFIRNNIFCILVISIITILVIVPEIEVINRYFPFVVGKKRREKNA